MKYLALFCLLSGCGSDLSEVSSFNSDKQESTPVQVVGSTPPIVSGVEPTTATYTGGFSGKVGRPASHEGKDYVNDDKNQVEVLVVASVPGTVAYIRYGCPQSVEFTRNTSSRECGAGWGNHVVVRHDNNLYTRYAHLKPKSIKVSEGDSVKAGDVLAKMGNSGRSELRHLHFELGTKRVPFDTAAPSQIFDFIYNPESLFK